MTQINANNVTVVAATKKEVMNMKDITVKKLKDEAKRVGVKGYSHMNKDALIAAIAFFTDEERKARESVVTPVMEEPVATVDAKRKNKIVLSLVIAWVLQTRYSFTGDGRVLFYVPTKRTDLKDVRIASRKRLSKVTGDLLNWVNGTKLEGQAFKDMVSEAYDMAVDAGICHRNGDDIHINKDEWAYCVKLYCKPFMRDSVKKYAEFLNANKKVSVKANGKERR